MLIRKHISLDNRHTTIALEQLFWDAIEQLAGQYGMMAWLTEQLKTKPATEGSASWIRQRVISNYLK